MKKYMLFVVLFSLLLLGCQKSQNPLDIPDNSKSTDMQNQYRMYHSFLETKGFYIGGAPGEPILHYYDPASGVSGFLCADPSCTHNSPDCDGWFSDRQSLSYYDGKLYYVAAPWEEGKDIRQTSLYSCDLSCKNRKKIKDIDNDEIIDKYGEIEYFVHRGMLYMVCGRTVVSGTEWGQDVAIIRTSLDGSKGCETLFTQSYDGGCTYEFQTVADTGYLLLHQFNQQGEENGRITEILRFDLTDGSCESFYKEENADDSPGSFWVISEEKIYMTIFDSEAQKYRIWSIDGGVRTVLPVEDSESYQDCILLDGAAFYYERQENPETGSFCHMAEVIDYAGNVLYKGAMFPEPISDLEFDPNQYYVDVVGGNAAYIVVQIDTFFAYSDPVILLDVKNNMKPTILWSRHVIYSDLYHG